MCEIAPIRQCPGCRRREDEEPGEHREQQRCTAEAQQRRDAQRRDDRRDASDTGGPARSRRAQRSRVRLGRHGVQRAPRPEVEERQRHSCRDDAPGTGCRAEQHRRRGRSDQEHRQRRASPPHLDEPRRDGVSGQLREGDEEREPERADEVVALREQDRRDPDEGPVVGEVDAEPHDPQRQRAHAELAREQVRHAATGNADRRRRHRDRCRASTLRIADRRRSLELRDDLVGLGVTPAALEPARRLGQAPAHDQRVCGGDGTERECPAPTVVEVRDDEVADQCRGRPPDRPEGLEDHDHTPSDTRRGELAHVRARDGQFRAEAEPHDDAQHDQRGESSDEGARAGCEPVHEHRHGKY